MVIHSIGDHTCPASKNVNYVMSHIGSIQKRTVMLDQSYHVITVDSEKARVASEVLEFANQFRTAQRRTANA